MSSSTNIEVTICPSPSRITARSLIAIQSPFTSSEGSSRAIHLPSLTFSRASSMSSACTDVSAPMLPHATPSTGREAPAGVQGGERGAIAAHGHDQAAVGGIDRVGHAPVLPVDVDLAHGAVFRFRPFADGRPRAIEVALRVTYEPDRALKL